MKRDPRLKVLKLCGRKAEVLRVQFGPFEFDPAEGLRRDGQDVPLPPRALSILTALLERPGSVVPKQTLLEAGWRDAFVTESSLLEAIRVIRDALGDDRLQPRYIQTIHRRGYRFIASVTRASDPVTDEVTRSQAGEPWAPLIIAGTGLVVTSVAIAIVFALFGQRPPTPRHVTRFTIALPQEASIDPLRGSVAISPDGTRLVYAAVQAGRPRLFLRTVDRDTPELIEGSDGATDPFVSPDGNWVGFFADGSLKKLRIEGGTPVALCAARAGAGATWDRDGTIVFGGGPGNGLARVSRDGGEPVVLIAPAEGSRDVSYGWPDVLPNGRGIVFTARSVADSSVAIYTLPDREQRTLVHSAAYGRYSPTGHLIVERRGRLEAAPFSLEQQKISAALRPILRGLATAETALAGPRFAFSRSGSLVYVPATSSEVDDQLHWLDRDGRLNPIAFPAAPVESVEVTPDLRRLAIVVESAGGTDLWIGDLDRGAFAPFTSGGNSVSPTWRPDGLEIAFAYSKAGPFNLFVRPPGTDTAPLALFESPFNQLPTSWSPDGRFLAYTEYHPMTGADIWMLDLQTRERRQLVRTMFDESHARFSPDGQWIAYMATEAGRWNVFVRPVKTGGTRILASTEGGAWPSWSIDGRTIYFSTAGGAAAAAIRTSPSLTISAPVMISNRDDLQLSGGLAASDRVLVRQAGITPARRELRVVLEWFVELARLTRLPV